MVLCKTGQIVDEIADLEAGLHAEKDDRVSGDENANAKMMEQLVELKDFMTADMNARTDENYAKHRMAESSLEK